MRYYRNSRCGAELRAKVNGIRGCHLLWLVVEEDSHLLVVLRYVEGNAFRARLVTRAEQWLWGSLAASRVPEAARFLSPWPVDRPRDWIEIVNQLPPKEELEQMRQSIQRDRPFGSKSWVQTMAARLGLETAFRPRGRPRKQGGG